MELQQLIDSQLKQSPKQQPHPVGYLASGTVKESKYTMTTRYRFGVPNMVSIEVDLPNGGLYQEGYDGATAWENDRIVDGEAAAALRHGAEWINPLKTIQQFIDQGHHAEYLGIETIDNIAYHCLMLTQRDGFARQYYLDTSKLLVVFARDVRPLHPGEDYKQIETVFSDYRMVDGIYFPFSQIDRETETRKVLLTVTFDSFELLTTLDPANFQRISLTVD